MFHWVIFSLIFSSFAIPKWKELHLQIAFVKFKNYKLLRNICFILYSRWWYFPQLPPSTKWSLSLQASTSHDRNTAALLAACLALWETIIGGQREKGQQTTCCLCCFFQYLTVSQAQGLRHTIKHALSLNFEFVCYNIIRQASKTLFTETCVCQLVCLLLSPLQHSKSILWESSEIMVQWNEIGLDKKKRQWDKQKSVSKFFWGGCLKCRNVQLHKEKKNLMNSSGFPASWAAVIHLSCLTSTRLDQDTCAAPVTLSFFLGPLWLITEWLTGHLVLEGHWHDLRARQNKSRIYLQCTFCNGSPFQLLQRCGKREWGDTTVSYSPQVRVSYETPSRHCNPREGSAVKEERDEDGRLVLTTLVCDSSSHGQS